MYRKYNGYPTQLLATQYVSTPPSSLIGRVQEVNAIHSLLQQPDIRLITILGPGGVGKTRIALEVTNESTDVFDDGIHFISLANRDRTDALLPSIARSLGIDQRQDPDVLAGMRDGIQDKHMLLLLDSFEEVVGASPELQQLLAICPYLKILVTSQTVLGIPEERTFQVAPLALPDLAYYHACDDLTRVASIALFLERARAARPDFKPTPHNIYTIAQICVRLDGLPLALELAAGRLKLFSPQELLARLNHRLSLLTGGPRGAPERQQTLRKTVERSYRLLTLDEQRLFRLLSVFVAGSTFHAVETVNSMVGGQSDQLFDATTSLLNHSLIRYEPQLGTEDQRFTMLGTHWEFAGELLRHSDDGKLIRQAHAEYYLDLANTLELMVVRGGTPCWVELVKCEFANLRAAFGWFLASRDAERALSMSAALWPFWLLSFSGEGQGWIKQSLESCGESGTPVDATTRARALHAAAMIEYYKGNWAHADILADESLLVSRTTDNVHGIAHVLITQATGALLRGLYEVASRALEESIQILRTTPHNWLMTEALLVMSYSKYMQGDYSQASRLGKKSFGARLQTNDLYAMMRVMYAQALFANAQNQYDEVESLYEEAVAITRATIKTGEDTPIAVCLIGLGALVGLRKRYTSAVRIWARARMLCDRWDGGSDLEPYAWLQVVLTIHLLHTEVIDAVRSQIDESTFTAAYLEGKSMTLEELLVDPGLQQQPGAASASKPASPYANGLTPREREVLQLLAQGLSNALIADQLVISLTTVNSHVRTIYSKLGVSSRSAATRYAIENNLA